jgi:hypothetical protein
MLLICLNPRQQRGPPATGCGSFEKKKGTGAFVSSSSGNSPGKLPMQERLTEAVSSIAELFERRHIRYALIGGLGVAFRGRKRDGRCGPLVACPCLGTTGPA